jgi:ABC-type multidrug transport system fused ATPase/permease subunit
LKEIELKGLLKSIGSVDQDVQLFDRSIRQNIQFGAQKELSDDRIRYGFDHCVAVWHLTRMVHSDVSKHA